MLGIIKNKIHKTGSIMFFTVQDALRNLVESYLEIGER